MNNVIRRWFTLLFLVGMIVCRQESSALAGTPAGTAIDNIATAQYNDGLTDRTSSSSLVRVKVAPVVAAELTPPQLILGTEPGYTVLFNHLLKNSGNTSISFIFPIQGGQWNPLFFWDKNSNGIIDPGESAPQGPLVIEAGQAVSLIVSESIPLSATDGQTDSFSLSAITIDGTLALTVQDSVKIKAGAPAIIDLVAVPTLIVADGKQKSILTATVKTVKGAPVADGTPVHFTTTQGTYENDTQTFDTTTINGQAITYLKALIFSTQPVEGIASVVAGSPATGMSPIRQIKIIFTPSAVTGTIIDWGNGKPVPGLTVILVGRDFPYEGTLVTGPDGSYNLPVPRLGRYTIRVPLTNSVGNIAIIEQDVEVTEFGQVYSPQGAIVGVVKDAQSMKPIPNVTFNLILDKARSGDRQTVATLKTDDKGGYKIDRLALGNYHIEVTDAGSDYYAHGRIVVSLSKAGQYFVNADVLLDPYGHVYNRVTGKEIVGAQVTLKGAATGIPVQVSQGTNPFITLADGRYAFLATPGSYTLSVTASGYTSLETPVFVVTRDAVNRDVYLEPLPTIGLRATKRAGRGDVQIGDVVPFEIVVENLSSAEDAVDVSVRDYLPSELGYYPGSSRLDGSPVPDPGRNGKTLTWSSVLPRLTPTTDPKKNRATLTFHCLVTARGGTTDIVNVADAVGTAASSGLPIMAVLTQARMQRHDLYFSERGTILGRVYVDLNENRQPDLGEPGVSNVALYTETGIMAITDEEGKYVMPDVSPGEHVIRIDLRTLPSGYQPFAADNASAFNPRSQFCRLQQGGLIKVNFALVGNGDTKGNAVPGTIQIKPVDSHVSR